MREKAIPSLTYAMAIAALGLALSSSFLATALADSPHFIAAFSSLSGSSLVCAVKEAGLGVVIGTIKETCSTTASAVYECVNNGGNAVKKETVTSFRIGSGLFQVRNGQTTVVSVTVAAPSPTRDFSCVSGQTLMLASVSYTGVILCDQLGNCVALADQFFKNPNAPQ